MDEKHELFLAGSWVSPAGKERIEIINPATEEPEFSVPEVTPDEIDRAVAAARDLHDSGRWFAVPIEERAAAVRRMADALAPRTDELTNTLAREMGAPVGRGSEAAGSVGLMQFYAAIAASVPFEQNRSGAFRPSLVERVPVGVVAAVVPWNAPVYLSLGKVVPAVLAGCPIILKPAPETAYSAYAIAEAAEAAGFPAGLISVLPAGREVSEYLVAHPGIDKTSFTGSTATGQRIAQIALSQFKRFSLELGGKSAGIVLPDVDLEAAIPAVVNGSTMNCGQVCALLSRLLVPNSLMGEFVERYVSAVEKIVVGDPLDTDTDMGPLVAERQLTRVLDYIEAGKQEGARIVLGGGRPAHLDKGWFVEPTVFIDVDNSMRIAREEIFGPVVSIIGYDTVDEAVAIANDSTYGLSGAVFGADKDAAIAMARRIRSGTVTVNTSIDFDFDMPFGGFKCSGIGREYGGVDGILNYTETRAIGL